MDTLGNKLTILDAAAARDGLPSHALTIETRHGLLHLSSDQ